MQPYSINLFGLTVECEIHPEKEGLVLRFSKETEEALNAYLSRALLRYGDLPNINRMTLEQKLVKAAEIEKSIGGRMSEPTVKLPYEFNPEIKEKLIEAASLQGISATQLLIRIIESKYNAMMAKRED